LKLAVQCNLTFKFKDNFIIPCMLPVHNHGIL
jgi:hypothetical protein